MRFGAPCSWVRTSQDFGAYRNRRTATPSIWVGLQAAEGRDQDGDLVAPCGEALDRLPEPGDCVVPFVPRVG